jgi:hypothetical protein
VVYLDGALLPYSKAYDSSHVRVLKRTSSSFSIGNPMWETPNVTAPRTESIVAFWIPYRYVIRQCRQYIPINGHRRMENGQKINYILYTVGPVPVRI